MSSYLGMEQSVWNMIPCVQSGHASIEIRESIEKYFAIYLFKVSMGKNSENSELSWRR